MDPELWRKIEELYYAACACDSAERPAVLERYGPEVRRAVESLLAQEGSLLERPAREMLPDRTTTMGPSGEQPDHRPRTPGSELFEARFLPGTVLANRYRIVNLLGRGGMGEVYRAMDLVLGQSVALKFLPEAVSQQSDARERLYNEVRAAREITHPQVCRVHDVGEIDGQVYISMEFVDGEDLASLLSRIGRLPVGKANELAAGICAGLAAAHSRGLVHRDLKPGNIMVDGRGQPRLMDFGLAASVGKVALSEVRSGTPLYMAPEQLAGKEVTVRSDLYALGLILYELFTGRRPFEGKSIVTLLAAREKNVPAPVSTLCPEVTPSVDSVITRCLSPDPARRPASAQAVAAALPYKDSLAAVMAAGNTPSPELIAASGDAKALRPVVAYGVAAAILGGLLGIYLLRAPISVAPDQPPEVLANTGRALARQLGYTARPAHTASGFAPAGTLPVPELGFWYRESDTPLQPAWIGNLWGVPGVVTPTDPPLEPGMRLLEMDRRGQLLRFAAAPQSPPPVNAQVDWKALFASAGLDWSRFHQTPPARLPPVAADQVLRWTSPAPASGAVSVEGASWMGQAVYFHVRDTAREAAADRPLLRLIAPVLVLILVCVVCAALFLARRNLRRQRGDRKGASRVGGAMFWICAVQWVLAATHSFSVHEAALASAALSWALAMGVLAYLCYVAIDPAVRRAYPDMLVSLQTVLTGGKRDALLGRDILFGLGMGVLISVLLNLRSPGGPAKLDDYSGLTLRSLAAIWMGDLRLGVWVGLGMLALLSPLFGLRRKRRMRAGALGVVIAETTLFCLRDMPPVPDTSAWYASAPIVGYLVFAALAAYAARLAVGSGSGETAPA